MSTENIQLSETDLLLIIDLQNDFCPGGALAVAGGDEIVAPINRLARKFDLVVMSQDWHPANHKSFAGNHENHAPFETVTMAYGPQILWPDHCVQGSHGAAFHQALDIPNTALILRKGYRSQVDSYSAFLENDRKTRTGLDGYLKDLGVRRLFLAGLATDFCVCYSALDARKLGYDVVLLRDLCRAIDIDGSLAAAIEQMNQAGVVQTESACIG